MEEAPEFATVIEADQLVQPVVIFADGRIRLVRLGDHAQLVVRVPPNPVVANLQDPKPLAVVPVPSEDTRALLDFA